MDLTARQKLTFGRRLEKLDKLLGSITPEQYRHEAFLTEYNPTQPTCGTVACALGWAVASKQFRGLAIKPAIDSFGGWMIRSTDWTKGTTLAADEFFGPGSYNHIFDVYAYPEPDSRSHKVAVDTVRARIRDVASDYYGYEFKG